MPSSDSNGDSSTCHHPTRTETVQHAIIRLERRQFNTPPFISHKLGGQHHRVDLGHSEVTSDYNSAVLSSHHAVFLALQGV